MFLLFFCAIHIFSIYAWVVDLKDKKGTQITNALQKILDNLIANQTKHGLIILANFAIDPMKS